MLSAAVAGCGSSTPVRAAAPLPDALAPVWSAPMETDYNAAGPASNNLAYTAHAVFLPAPDGDMTALNPTTGAVLWRAAPYPHFNFSGDAVIGGRLYAYMTNPNQKLIRLIAFNASNGAVIWRNIFVALLYRSIGLDQVAFTSRGILIQLGVDNLLFGLSLSTGRIIWHAALPANCDGGSSTVAPAAVLFLLECTGSGTRLEAIDPANGHVSWQRELARSWKPDYPIELYPIGDGEIVAETGADLRIYSPGGSLIVSRAPPLGCQGGSCAVGADGSAAVLEAGANSNVVQGISLATGQVQWRRSGELLEVGAVSTAVAGPGGILYVNAGPALAGSQTELLPAFMVAIQASTGRFNLIPVPVIPSPGTSVPAGYADGLVFVQSQTESGPTVTALRPEYLRLKGPVQLSGVAASQWPDACALLPTSALGFISAGYVSSPRPVTLAGVKWPKAVTCAYVGPGAGDPAVTLTVAWVAPTAAQAQLLQITDLGIQGSDSGPPPRVPGGYVIYGGGVSGQYDRVLITAGRAIAELTVPGNARDAIRLAPLVESRLNAIYASR
jgi:outer membrane protein assembly factor BamB